MVNVMFLGGPLDHAIREVPADYGLPRECYVYQDIRDVYPGGPTMSYSDYPCRRDIVDQVVYQRHRLMLDASPHRWWAYVAPGYEVTPQDVIDALPSAIKEALHA